MLGWVTLLLLLLLLITFIQDTYLPETNHFSVVYNIAALLWLQYMTQIILYPMECM